MRIKTILIIGLMGLFIGVNMPLKSQADTAGKKISLLSAIEKISKEYDVYFTFDVTLVSDVLVEYENKIYSTAREAISTILKSSAINYKFYDQRFVILYKKGAEGMESLKVMSKHLDSLIKEEDTPDETASNREVIELSRLSNRFAKESIQQPDFSVTGTVTDQSGQPLPGVTVLIKGTTTGTVTDINGNFYLNVHDGTETLQFSFVGMSTQEVQIAGRTTFNVVMEEETIGLEEVVAIGYGTQKRATITGAISTISPDNLKESSTVNLTNAIGGQLSGIIANVRTGNPGADDATIFIRGKGTTGNNEPLIIIDGIPSESFSRLNPEDIESFSILKDASAAIYGARAANGVILITTKRGKEGKPIFTFESSYGISQPTRLPNVMDSWQYAIAENEYAQNFSGQALKWTDEDIQKFKDGSSPLTHPNTNWQDVLFKEWSGKSIHTLSVRGGTKDVKYFVSGQYLHQDGNFINNNHYYNQLQWRTNLDAQLTRSFSIGFDMAYRRELRNYVTGILASLSHELRTVYPYLVDYYPNGLPGVGIGAGANLAQYTTSDAGADRRLTDILHTKISYNWQLFKGLSLTGYGSYDLNNSSQKNFLNTWDEYTYDATTDSYVLIPSGNVRNLRNTKNNSLTYLLHSRLEYNISKNEHNLNAFIAHELSEYSYNYLMGYRDSYPSGAIQQLFAGADNINKTNDGYENETSRINYFGRINYDFEGKYLISGTIRHDGSHNFPKNKRFGTFPSISVGWRISEESFIFDNFPSINNLKIKASWGKMGNDNVASFQYLTSYRLGTNAWWWWRAPSGSIFGDNLDVNQTLIESGIPNPNITWETATTTNIGLEGSFFNFGLEFNVDVFESKRTGILTRRNLSIPVYTGLTLPDENLGIVKNRGLDLQLTHRKKLNDDFSYSVAGNFTFARNKVIFMDEALDTPEIQKREGFPIDSWLVYKADGLFQTQEEVDNYPSIRATGPGDIKLIDIDEDGSITSLDQIRLTYGSTPEIMYGTTLGLSYKNFDFSLFLQGQANSYLLVKPYRLNHAKEWFEGRWQKQGDNIYPRIFNGPTVTSGQSSYNSTFWLKKADFLRLKNIYISYNLPKDFLQSINFPKILIYVSGSNLFTFDNIKLFDPEITSQDGVAYQIQRNIQLGIKLNF